MELKIKGQNAGCGPLLVHHSREMVRVNISKSVEIKIYIFNLIELQTGIFLKN
jgi:hypothetical protein